MMKAFRESKPLCRNLFVESWMEHLRYVRLKKWLGHFISVTNSQKFLVAFIPLLRR